MRILHGLEQVPEPPENWVEEGKAKAAEHHQKALQELVLSEESMRGLRRIITAFCQTEDLPEPFSLETLKTIRAAFGIVKFTSLSHGTIIMELLAHSHAAEVEVGLAHLIEAATRQREGKPLTQAEQASLAALEQGLKENTEGPGFYL